MNQNKQIKLFKRAMEINNLPIDYPYKILEFPLNMVISFLTVYFAPIFTVTFIDNQFLTLLFVILGFYLIETVSSLKYKNEFSNILKNTKEDISKKVINDFNFIKKLWFYYIEMGPLLLIVQSWFLIIFRENTILNSGWYMLWSTLIVWSFFALLNLLYKRYLFLSKILDQEKNIEKIKKELNI
jgi:hypothetical protein